MGTGTQKQYEGLCDCLDLDHLKTDKRFLTNSLRLANRPALNEYLEEAIGKKIYKVFQVACNQKSVTIAPVNNLEQVFNKPNAQKLVLSETLKDGRIKKAVRTAVFKIK